MSETTRIGDQLGLWDAPSEPPTTLPEQGRRSAGPGDRPNRRPGAPVELRAMWGIDDVANYLGPKQTVCSWRKSGYGPKGIRVGKHLRWRASVVIDWTLAQERKS